MSVTRWICSKVVGALVVCRAHKYCNNLDSGVVPSLALAWFTSASAARSDSTTSKCPSSDDTNNEVPSRRPQSKSDPSPGLVSSSLQTQSQS